MKGKPKARVPRRAAGLQIRAALEPRPDSGADLASDIFRAVREEEQTKQQFQNKDPQKIVKSLESIDRLEDKVIKKVAPQATGNNQKSSQASEAEVASGTTLIRFGGGQMRVVSRQQQQKSRKPDKQPKKALQILTGSNETQKIPALFERTKAEELYDLLFQLTLGADEPCDSVRVRRADLMASTNIKTRLTLDLNLKRLEENKLVAIESRPGEQEGNIYTVFPLPKNN